MKKVLKSMPLVLVGLLLILGVGFVIGDPFSVKEALGTFFLLIIGLNS